MHSNATIACPRRGSMLYRGDSSVLYGVEVGSGDVSGSRISAAREGIQHASASTVRGVVVFATVVMVVGLSACDWTGYLGGNGRTGWNAGENKFTPAAAATLHQAWKVADSGVPESGVFSQPIVSKGVVYWGSFRRLTSARDEHLRAPCMEDVLGTYRRDRERLRRPLDTRKLRAQRPSRRT